MNLKHKVISALSWRVEARAAGMSPSAGARVRHRWGTMLGMAGAHRTLPATSTRAAILCFHAVTAHRPDPEVESDSLDVRSFRKLLRVLRTSFRVIPLAELVDAVHERRPPPPRSIAITFDDGYANNHTVAAEELASMHMPWSAFLPAMLIETQGRQWIDDVRLLLHRGRHRRLQFAWGGEDVSLDLATAEARRESVTRVHQACRYVPEPERKARLAELYGQYSTDELAALRERYGSFAPMTWSQAAELKSAGVDVGSHSLNHIALAPQPIEAVRQEVFGARELLQARIGDHSPHFSYPYGREASISAMTEQVVAEAGYRCGLTLEQDIVNSAGAIPLALPRLIVSAQVGRVLFGLWQRFNG